MKPLASGLPVWITSVPFILIHVACLGVIWTGFTFTWVGLALCGFCYFIRMFGITAGYHRYFSHRTYKTSRPFQFVMAWLGCMSLQKGPLWWAAHHRNHHKYSDTEKDVHSPITGTFWWSHLGWLFDPRNEETDWEGIHDFAKYPELRWLNTYHWVPGITLAVICWLVGGLAGYLQAEAAFSVMGAWSALVIGFFWSTVLLYHGTFAVNSLCHIFGTRRYATTDQSKNNWWVALFTLGEGWHNNHHHYQSSANQGFFWWELDVSYYLIQTLALFGLVWDVRKPPRNKKYVGFEEPQSSFPTMAGS